MGHSSKAPWLNRKKLMLPESTAAITMFFLPALSAANGCGRCWDVGGGINDGNSHKKTRLNVDVWVGEVIAAGGGWTDAGTPRFRGRGGGVSGSTLNSSVNSYSEGTEAVRALLTKGQLVSLDNYMWTYLTTTIWKSGCGGDVFRKLVEGLYIL